MNSLAITLVLASAVMHALRDFLTKKAHDKRTFMWMFSALSQIIFLPIFLYYLVREGWPSGIGLFIVVAVSFIHFAYWLFLSKAYDDGDLSHIYPIVRSSPAFVLLLSILLFGEQASKIGIAGVLLTVLGAYIINMKHVSPKELIAPFARFKSEPHTQYAVATLISVSAYSIIDNMGVQFVHPIVYLYLLNLFSVGGFTIYTLRTRTHAQFAREWKDNKPSLFLNAIIGLVGYGLILYAMQIAPVSYVVGLRQLSIVFAVLLGGHILREKHRGIRLTAALTIFVGAFLISIA